jgi:hypothetical protein
VQHLRDDVLSAPAGLERLYTLPHEFSDAWFAFRSAEDDADRVLALSVDQSSSRTGCRVWGWTMPSKPRSRWLTWTALVCRSPPPPWLSMRTPGLVGR